MTPETLTTLLRHLRRITGAAAGRLSTDRELLEQYVSGRDEAAFTALVRRHGGLVLSACRQVLADEADVEDTFQATFLVLLRKAGSVRWQASVGNWLFGVAHRVAVQARANNLRRRRREAEAAGRKPEAGAPPDLAWSEAVGLLHQGFHGA